MWSELSQIIFPSRCIACNVLGPSVCTNCRKLWNLHLHSRIISNGIGGSLRVISASQYSSIAQKIMLAAKEDGTQAADQLIINALVYAASHFLKKHQCDFLVPMPSRRSASRRRGRVFMEEISMAVGEEINISSRKLISYTRKVQDQSELHLHERRNNLRGAFVVATTGSGLSTFSRGGRALLVDDLITSGSTLTEGARALSAAGIEVSGAITACSAMTNRPIR